MDVSISRQIDALNALRQNIESLELSYRRELTYKPEKLLNDLEAMGFPKDLANVYRIKYLAVDDEKVNEIIRFIDNNMIRYIDEQIAILRKPGLSDGSYGGF